MLDESAVYSERRISTATPEKKRSVGSTKRTANASATPSRKVLLPHPPHAQTGPALAVTTFTDAELVERLHSGLIQSRVFLAMSLSVAATSVACLYFSPVDFLRWWDAGAVAFTRAAAPPGPPHTTPGGSIAAAAAAQGTPSSSTQQHFIAPTKSSTTTASTSASVAAGCRGRMDPGRMPATSSSAATANATFEVDTIEAVASGLHVSAYMTPAAHHAALQWGAGARRSANHLDALYDPFAAERVTVYSASEVVWTVPGSARASEALQTAQASARQVAAHVSAHRAAAHRAHGPRRHGGGAWYPRAVVDAWRHGPRSLNASCVLHPTVYIGLAAGTVAYSMVPACAVFYAYNRRCMEHHRIQVQLARGIAAAEAAQATRNGAVAPVAKSASKSSTRRKFLTKSQK